MSYHTEHDAEWSEAARLAAVRRTGALDVDMSNHYRGIISLAKHLTGAPLASLGLIDDRRLYLLCANFPSALGITEIRREDSLCQHVLPDEVPVMIEDLRTDPRTSANPFVLGPPFLRFWAGFPIISAEGHILGSLSVADFMPRRLEDITLDLMQDVALQVSHRLDLQSSRHDDLARRMALLLHSLNDHLPDMTVDLAYGFLMLCSGLYPDVEATEALIEAGLADAAAHQALTLSPLGMELRRALGLQTQRAAPRRAHTLTEEDMATYLAQITARPGEVA